MGEGGIEDVMREMGYRDTSKVSREAVDRTFAQGGPCSICGDENTRFMFSKRRAGIVVSSKFFCEACFEAVMRAAQSIEGPVLFRAGPFG